MKKLLCIAVLFALLSLAIYGLVYYNSFDYKAKLIMKNMDEYNKFYDEYRNDILLIRDSLMENKGYRVLKDNGFVVHIIDYSYPEYSEYVKLDELKFIGSIEKDVIKKIMQNLIISDISFGKNSIYVYFNTNASPYEPKPCLVYSPEVTPALHNKKDGLVILFENDWYFVIDVF